VRRLQRDGRDRAAVAPVARGQLGGGRVYPALHRVRRVHAGEDGPDRPLEAGGRPAQRLHPELFLTAGEVVRLRAPRCRALGHDLAPAGGRIALRAEQSRGGRDHPASAVRDTGHGNQRRRVLGRGTLGRVSWSAGRGWRRWSIMATGGCDWTPTPCERDTTTAARPGVTPSHRQGGLVSTPARPAGQLSSRTNVSPVILAEIQTHVDLDASRVNPPITDCDWRGVAARRSSPAVMCCRPVHSSRTSCPHREHIPRRRLRP
jgi:hypothetical protein